MNRIIKFRVWDKGIHKYLLPQSNLFIDTESGYPDLTQRLGNKGNYFSFDYSDDNCIFQQYTGLKDKNNKDIYEGDIIKFTMEIGPHCSFRDFKLSDAQKVGFGEVKWGSYSDGEYADDIECYMLNNNSLSELIYRTKRDFQQYIRAYEVVGNIFENKDLLK